MKAFLKRNYRKCTALILSFIMTFTAVSATTLFSDVDAEYPYANAINLLNVMNVAKGAGDGNFYPEEFITRAEFITMTVAAFSIDGSSEHSFEDVSEGAYYADAVGKAVNAGVVKGKSATSFAPDDCVTHQEAAIMLVNAYEKMKGVKIPISEAVNGFDDGGDVAQWAISGMDKAITYRFAPVWEENLLRPDNKVTRGEAAQLIGNALLVMGETKNDDFVKETKFIQKTVGNIFLRSEKVEIGVSTGVTLIGWEVRGWYGDILKKGYTKTRDGEATFNFDDLDIGHYSLKVFANDKDGMRHDLAQTFFGIIQDYDFMQIPESESPFGINTSFYKPWEGWDSEATASLIYKMGARNIRDGVAWYVSEPKQGEYVVYQPATIERLKAYGMTQLFATGGGNSFYDNGGTPWTKEGLQAFANYVKALYDLHDGYVKYVDVYNEYWAPRFGDSGGAKSQADALPSNYYNMVKTVWETVKPEYPESVLGMVVGNSGTYKAWTEELFSYGALNYADYLQYHTYTKNPETEIKEDIDFFKSELQKYDMDVPIWLDEVGGHTASAAQGLTTREQAMIYPRQAAVALGNGVEKIYHYNLMNDGYMDTDNEDNFGTIYNQSSPYGPFVPKETYISYCNMTRQLTTLDKREIKSEGEIMHYTFSNSEKQVDMLYSLEDVSVTLLTEKPLKVTDVMGKVSYYEPYDGKIYLDLSSEVLYLEGDFEVVSEAIPMQMYVENAVIGAQTEFVFSPYSFLKDVEMTGRVGEDTFNLKDNYKFKAASEKRTNTYVIDLEKDGKPFARLRQVVDFNDAYHIEAESTFDATAEKVDGKIKISITNYANEILNIDGIEYDFSGHKGVYTVTEVIEPNTTSSMEFDLPEVIPGKMYDVQLRIIRDGELSQSVDYMGRYHYSRMYRGSLPVGATTDAHKAAALHVQDNAFDRMYVDDEKDIYSDVWVAYDNNYLYIRAEVKDDLHTNNGVEAQIWNGDNIQIDFTNEKYRFNEQPKVYWEFGFALSGAGKKSGWVWMSPATVSNAAVEKASPGTIYDVTRDEDTLTTTYEVQIPWADLAPVVMPTDTDALCMTIVFNEGDAGGVREGWTTWGLGVAEGKNPAKYNILEVID